MTLSWSSSQDQSNYFGHVQDGQYDVGPCSLHQGRQQTLHLTNLQQPREAQQAQQAP
eukprot:CAMPEP_0176175810 /NCGR_PEP_ID=MMETSP0120_2-20121206/90063_1 /TAXON_ID=160619 /ORGANISM="Kryptoperidinium foliaceum, Strain CCMP 1326" /LENGTH=56 /DNA_ID=CAMNT_0017513859 /DNA_START=451 /DNA_END=621 /DNA_ORIENTATION=-